MSRSNTALTLRTSRVFLPGLIIAFALAAMAALLSTGPEPAAAGLNQGAVVPETPRRDVPVVLDGEVRAHAQVGDLIFVGGDFQDVQLNDGTVITQPYLFAYDVNTGELDPNFRPLLNKAVKSLEATPSNDGLYVGGQFTRWETADSLTFPLRLAKLDALGELDPAFSASVSAQVLSIAATGDDVYIGGNFTDVSANAVTGVAKLDATTGAIDTSLNIVLGSTIKSGQLVQRVKLTPDGQSLFVMHYGSTVNGVVREGVFKVDLSGPAPTLSGWNIDMTAQTADTPVGIVRNCWTSMRDMAVSPDGSFLVIGGQGNDVPPNCDSVLKYSTAGTTTVDYLWSARMYSSVFSLAVSDVAVYVGGHFCAAPKNPIAAGGISSPWPSVLARCNTTDPLDGANPSVIDADNAVFRNQIAALDPVTGQALPWDPGSNNFVAVYDLTLIDRGLLAGHDGDRYNTFLVGRSGFFDFGVPADTEGPTIAATDPAPGTIVSDATELAGVASDNRDVVSVTIRLKNITTNQWLQADGSFAATQADLPVTLTDLGLGEVAWSTPVTDLPSGDYEIRGFATDEVGNTSDSLVSPFAVPGATSCTVTLDENDVPVVTYTDFLENGVTNVNIRRDGSWLATAPAGNGSYTDSTAAPGDYTYVVRWRPDGVNTDITCTPDPITVPQGGGGVTCTVGLDANGDPVLSWTSVPGLSNYVIREAGLGYVSTVTGSTTYTDAGRAPGDYEYVLRYRPNGVVTDLSCTPSPITVPDLGGGDACTVAVTAAGEVQVNWTDVAGEDSYQVRDDDGWVATVNNNTSYLDTAPTSGDRSYVVRYRMAGVTTNVSCSPDPVVVP